MLAQQPQLTSTITANINTPVSIAKRQAPLRARYATAPDAAWITDRAITSWQEVPAGQPLYGQVTFGTGFPAELTYGVHKAVGGESDFPNPGEILAAAVASCLDSSTRMIANHLGIRLKALEVTVEAKVDVRGTLRADKNVPVGFQEIDVSIFASAVEGVTEAQLNALLTAAEQSCVLIQTLRGSPVVQVKRVSASD